MPISSSSRNQPPVGEAFGRRAVQRVDLPARRAEARAPAVHRVELDRSEVGVHDRVGQHAAGPRVAVDDVAGGRDLRVGEHVRGGRPRRRREQRDRGLGRAEHERRPRGAVDHTRVDLARPTLGIGHAQEAAERGRAGADPAGRVDQVRLHVDHRRGPRNAASAASRLEGRGLGYVEEAAAVRVVDRSQRRGGAAAIGRVARARPSRAGGVTSAIGAFDRGEGVSVDGPPGERCVLVARHLS